MALHRYALDDDRRGAPGRSYGRRHFWHWGPEENRSDAHVDVYLNRPPGHGWGFMLRLDGVNAETPLDAAIWLGRWLYVFAGTSKGSRLNRWLRLIPTKDNHWQVSREISLRLSGTGTRFLVNWLGRAQERAKPQGGGRIRAIASRQVAL